MEGLVSIVMPSYNTAPYISASIQSVLAQDYTNWELLIVDDCSSDNSLEIIRPYLFDKRIRLFINDRNRGPAFSRNLALREAKGKWIAFLDSDDLWMPQKLSKQIVFMESHNYHFSYTDYSEMDAWGHKTGVMISGPKIITKTGFYNFCWPGCLTVMYDVENVGLIQIVDIKKNNDYAMWLKVCRKTDCYLLDEDLAIYRRGRTGSVSTHSIITMISWHYRLFKDVENQTVIHATFNTVRNLFFGFYKKKRYVKQFPEYIQ